LHTIFVLDARYLVGKVSSRKLISRAPSEPLVIIDNLDSKKPSFRPSKWPQKLKTAKNSKSPKLLENYFEQVGQGGWPLIST
jgi:hypothetical protein